MTLTRTDFCYVVAGVLTVLTACLATEPFVEIGINDDWSYIRSAQILAKTGRIVYNGWAAAMLGAQLYWGALFALIFGDSRTAVRLSCIPLALLSVTLCYMIFRRSGISPTPSFIGTLTVGVSPLFLPYAVTFMSEMPSLVLFLATVYAFSRADDSREESDSPENLRVFVLWMIVGTIVGVAGGTVRQINWILAVIAPALIAFRTHKSGTNASYPAALRTRLTVCAVSFTVILGLSAGASSWFALQPYSIVERVDTAFPAFLAGVFNNWGFIGDTNHDLWCTLVLLTLPVVPLAPRLIWRTPAPQNRIPMICAALLLAAQWVCKMLPPYRTFPWMENTVTEHGVWPGLVSQNYAALTGYMTGDFVRWVSYAVVVLASLILAHFAYLFWQPINRRNVPFALMLWGLFVSFYVPLFWVRPFLPSSFGVFDRYLLPVMPGFVLAILHFGRVEQNDSRLPVSRIAQALGAVLVFVYGCYGVVTTSDHFRESDAVRRITDRMVLAGVDREYINAGLSYNAETQMGITGYYNDPRLTLPRNAYRVESTVARPHFYWGKYTPDVWGVFRVTLIPYPQLYDLDVAPEPVLSRFTGRNLSFYVQSEDERYDGMTLDMIAESISRSSPTKGYRVTVPVRTRKSERLP